ncbi:MAG TPA: transposase [Ignavibacteria bacterium]|nr:transposase [Ignavibacteria bacterium]
MFKPNNQPSLITFEAELSEKQKKLLERSKEKWFYQLILQHINENLFKVLYSKMASRPNVAVNILVSALILKELRGMSYNELMESVMFDLRIKVALGLVNIDDIPFSRATLFNFQNRILNYENKSGINLIEQVFDSLTVQQLETLSIKTDIQRTDSTLISSNIRKYSRIQLLIEVLIRLSRKLDETDKALIAEKIQPYLKTGSEKYVYGLKPEILPRELSKLGQVYHFIYNEIGGSDKYRNTKEFTNFLRVYKEHFIIVEQEVKVKSNEQLNSSMLQSPDDQQATYRQKRAEQSKGFTINATETANPEDPINLLTDIAVNPNNVDDTKILNHRLDKIKEKTPELNEMHTDGGYGSEDNDKKFEEMGITQVTTAVRGRKDEIEKKIEKVSQSPDIYTVECPYQKLISVPTKKRHKVRFDLKTCEECPLHNKCQIFKNKGRYYFTQEDYLLNKRNRNITNIPEERRKIRPNVEATMKEFKVRTRGGKTKVRGLFKTSLFAFNVGIAINFGRIYRYIMSSNLDNDLIISILTTFSRVFQYFLFKSGISNFISPIFPLYGHLSNKFSNMRFYRTLNFKCF